MQLKCYLKNEQGYNSYFKINGFVFKNENEWRFVPNKSEIGNGLISQHKSRYLKNPDYYNKKLNPYPLRFKRTSILKVYVENLTDKNSMISEYPELTNKVEISNWN